jgi:cell division septal protein FtsQ
MERRLERNLSGYVSPKPSPILGRQKAREVNRSRSLKEILVRGLKAALITSGVLLFVLSAYLIKDALLHSHHFDITNKEIRGLHYVPESLVLIKMKEFEELHKNLFALDISQLRKAIELLPWVKEAIVQRTFPDKLTIYIKERVPIAFARTEQGTCLVDEDGILLENSPANTPAFDFPVLNGLEPGLDQEILNRNKTRISLYRSLIESLDTNGTGLSRDLSEIDLHDIGNISVIANEDTVLVHLGTENLQEKFRRYLAMSRELKRKYPYLDSVDLRYQNQVVINTASGKITNEVN